MGTALSIRQAALPWKPVLLEEPCWKGWIPAGSIPPAQQATRPFNISSLWEIREIFPHLTHYSPPHSST